MNHFTVLTNALRTFDSLEQVNDFLELNGFVLNASGGLIKGGPVHCSRDLLPPPRTKYLKAPIEGYQNKQ